MILSWTCCRCDFGPHNLKLHEQCIQCGTPRCARCVAELFSDSPRPPSPNPEEGPHAAVGKGKKPQREGMEKTQVKEIASSSRCPSTSKPLTEEFDSGFEVRKASVSPETARDGRIATVLPTLIVCSDEQELDSTISVTYSPSLCSTMMDWIHEQDSLDPYFSNDIQLLEAVLVELKSSGPENIFVSFEKGESLRNSLKGKLEAFLDRSLDWWPFQPYMSPLTPNQVSIHWKCPCGDTRSVAVPWSFGKKIADTSTIQAAQSEVESSTKPHSSASGIETPGKVSPNGNTAQARAQHGQPDPGPQISQLTVNRQSIGDPSDQLHAFLIILNTSLVGSAHCLTQTDVRGMNDQTFFAWIRKSYYSRRRLHAIWFDLSSFSHCEFFRFDGFEYAPLLPEYPKEDEPLYHFSPKPMRPRPPMSSHEFNHRFYKESWSRIARRWRLTSSQRSRAKGLWSALGSRYVVEEKIPKRETPLEEGVLEHEDFWGLYVVEKLSVLRLVIYSLTFLSPSVYFFFAWLFEWGHGGDLQNASVPIALSLAPLATFWGFVLSTSHGSASTRVL